MGGRSTTREPGARDLDPRRISRLAALALAGIVAAGIPGCGDEGGVGPLDGDELEVTLTSAHYVYRMSASDAQGVDTVWQETWHRWILQELQLDPSWKLEYRKYRDQDHMLRVTGHDRGTGFAEPGDRVFHTIWNEDNHEATHVLWVELVGEPPSFFNEGVAVAHHADPFQQSFDRHLWNSTDIHTLARTHLRDGTLPDLDRLIETNEFWKLDGNVTYPVAGSFVRWLIDQRGIGPFKTFNRTTARGAGTGTIRASFRDAYGWELDGAWAQWQGFLGG